MDIHTYKEITSVIRKYRGLSRNCLKILLERFPSIRTDTLSSILSSEYQKRMKLNHIKTQSSKNTYWELYKNAVDNGESPGIIVRISENYDVAPCLVGKLILQKYFEDSDSEVEHSNLNLYMRDTTLIQDMDLAYEIFYCTMFDNLYSPLSETIKHSIGQQYEIKLHNEIVKLGLSFRDEEHLRKYGYDKTPDVKLEVPVAVDGIVINWIESKALFGDEDCHKDYMNNQYLSYWNRFGSGLVIYWFGFVETLIEAGDKRLIIRDHLPTNVIHMVPPSIDAKQ